MKHLFVKAAAVALLTVSSAAFATSYTLPSSNQSIIGSIQHKTTGTQESVLTIAKQYDLGYNAIENANPTLDMGREFPQGSSVQIPTQHLLPSEAREGIVINLPEMRMYYYPAGTNEVLTYPIGIGRIGKMIPIKRTSVTYKKKDPVWIPPKDIREFNLAKGVVLPRVMPSGPDNPLGEYAIYMTIPTYLMHSTPYVESIGTRASFGCIRMYPTDIQGFFPTVAVGTPIIIINKPIKLGWQTNQLMMESHPSLEEHSDAPDALLPGVVSAIAAETDDNTLVDWQMVAYLSKKRDGIPHEVGTKLAQ
jgi:L,D-transpeptidase ErfK/SrfK